MGEYGDSSSDGAGVSGAAARTAAAVPCWRDQDLGTDAHPFGRSFRPLSPAEAEAIAAMDDAVRRNLRITQGYHDLTMSMTCLLGSRDVSWCAFATWASRTAGHFIRGDFVPDIVQDYLAQVQSLHRALRLAIRLLTRLRGGVMPLHTVLVASIERVVEEVAASVAVGNRIVFAELAPLFARMVEEFRDATAYDPEAIRRFLSVLRPGPVAEGGQDLLIQAFGNYYEAMFEPEPKSKAERILLANYRIGLHEQTRLQGPILGALNAPIADIIRHAAHERAREVMPRRLQGVVERTLDRILDALAAWLQRTWAEVATRWLMHIELPRGSMSLGRDLRGPGRRAGPASMFPAELVTIEDEELAALLYRLDYTPNTTSGSGARDWGSLADRMNYVVDFFRAYQQDRALYRQPFTHAQVEVIRAGGIPAGDL